MNPPPPCLWASLLADIKAHWRLGLIGAVGGAVVFILLGETVRWWLGKGFFK